MWLHSFEEPQLCHFPAAGVPALAKGAQAHEGLIQVSLSHSGEWHGLKYMQKLSFYCTFCLGFALISSVSCCRAHWGKMCSMLKPENLQ